MAPRKDRFSVKRQAARLGLTDAAAEKEISKLTRSYVLKKMNNDPTNFVSLTDGDLLSFAQAFVASHGSWLRQNRQPWRTEDGARPSEDREEDITVINRMMQLQSLWQKQKVIETGKTSLDMTTGVSVARQRRSRPNRRRRQSSTSDVSSIFSLSPTEDEGTPIREAWTDDYTGAGRKRRRLHQGKSLAGDDFGVIFDKADQTAPASSQQSAADDTIYVCSRSGLPFEAITGDSIKALHGTLSDTTSAIRNHAAAQTSADRSPYQQADALVQTSSVYRSISTQNDAPSLHDRSQQTTSAVLAYSSIQTLADYAPLPSTTESAAGDNKPIIVETGYYEALVYLSLWREEAEALTRQLSETFDRSKIMQLKKVKDRVEYVIGFMSPLAQGGEIKLRLREEREYK